MGEFSYKPLIEAMTWSYSRLTSFEVCPYKWFCTYIRGEEEAPMFYSSYGSFVHSLIERFYSGELSKEELRMEFLLGFQWNVLGERPPASTVEKYITAGSRYFENFEPFPFEPLAVEKKLNFCIDGVNFTAVVDFIGGKDGKLAIVDHKSRELKPRSGRKNKPTAKDAELDEMLRQLYLYAHGIREIYGEYPEFLCFNCFRNGQFIKEPFDFEAYKKTIAWAKDTAAEIAETEEFRPNMEYFQCKYLCGLHDDCIFYRNR